MAPYCFRTTWLVEASREEVWAVLREVEDWPRWWRGVESVVELAPGDGDRVGSRYRTRWRGRLPYRVEFDFAVERVSEPSLMSGRASGDLEGTGTWRLFAGEGSTAVVYDWHVRPAAGWARALGPALRSIAARNHDWVMRRGGEGLARELGSPGG